MALHGYNVLPTKKTTKMNTQLYRHFDEEHNLLYVGISLSTFARLSQHKEHSAWFKKIKSVEIENFDTREGAMAAERKAICTEDPMFNIAMKKTMAEIEKEKKQLIREVRIEQEKKEVISRYVDHRLAYKMDDVMVILSMQRSELERHINDGNLSFFEVECRPSKGRPPKIKKMVSGWSLIDFINYLERKSK
jgi:predicted GIY-YIG superfamily endonuclease